MIVIGIDPGLQRMGWGVIRAEGSRLSHVANGTCTSDPADPLAERLMALHRQLRAVLHAHSPDAAAVEQTFVNKDGAGTLKLGQARGVAMLAVAQAGLRVGEYAPNAVKKAVVGVGLAGKKQVEHMVRMQLPGVRLHGPDAADALAVAITHSFHVQASGRLAAALRAAE
jgi:crossover junction endodeoxyribonuclease RuvC